MNCNQNFNKTANLNNVIDKTVYCCHAICYKVKYLKQLINFIYPMKHYFDHNIVEFIKTKNYDICIPNKTLGLCSPNISSVSDYNLLILKALNYSTVDPPRQLHSRHLSAQCKFFAFAGHGSDH